MGADPSSSPIWIIIYCKNTMTMTYYDNKLNKINKATIKGNSYTTIQKFGVGKILKKINEYL